MKSNRANHTPTLLTNGKVLLTGGDSTNLVNGSSYSSELYNPTTGTCSYSGSMITSRYYHTATLLPNGMVLVTGGVNANSNALSSCELYNPSTGTWRSTGSMASSRKYHTATLLANGNVLVTGGENVNNSVLSSNELYNPSTGIWSSTGSMSNHRLGHTATLLSNGKILVTGGYGGISINGIISSCELYNPTTGTWANTVSMANSRETHTASLLSNGNVLVTGGVNNSQIYLKSCELFNPSSNSTGALRSNGIIPSQSYSNNLYQW